jgi:sialic acid synthase SpsE/mannose-6-phosphate isomerase-like protein (cupin superfamily)
MEKPLVIFEMANNHMGDVAHGSAVIRAFAAVARPFQDAFRFAFKLQYRDLDSFIHPAFKGRDDVKYVKRFESTRLEAEAFDSLLAVMRECGFTTACTPFDEPSVDRIEAQGIDIVKIASCSFTDWPLLERIAKVDKPIIASTAGAGLADIDAVVSFFQHRNKRLTILHCVAEYPTPPEKLAINQIELLRTRYPGVTVGFSTHEPPALTTAIMLALAKGASVIEKHVGLPTEKYPNNAYSASPEQISAWLAAGRDALAMLGTDARIQPSAGELDSLGSLQRGVFAKRDLPAGHVPADGDVFFAFPAAAGQVTANQWSKYARYELTRPLAALAPLMAEGTNVKHLRELVLQHVEAVRHLLRTSGVSLPGKADLELSHHYGLERFGEHGLTMLTVVNRAYCKKILVLLPGQAHPEQFHKQKEETFVVLHGSMTVALDRVEQEAKAGDVITVERGVKHAMRSAGGCVFEEISSTHYTDDSYYTDPAIAANKSRKTHLTHWM